MTDSLGPFVYSVVYTSAETTVFDDEDLEALLVHARDRNEKAGITGVLLYRRGRFVQYLEGGEREVRALIERIASDPRHTGVRVIIDDRYTTRHFPHWTMGYVSEDFEPGSMPIGFRVAFNDLDSIDDSADAAALRALRELSQWFRAQSS